MKTEKIIEPKKCIMVVCEILIIALIVAPIVVLSMYSVPIADDFGTANEVKRVMENGNNVFVASILCTLSRYVRWGGFYSAQFLNFLFNPISAEGFERLRWVISMINVLFGFSLFCFVKMVLNKLFQIMELSKVLLVYIFMLLAFTNNRYNTEIYFWYCVSVAYVLLVALMFMGGVLYVQAIKSKKIWQVVVSAVLGFIVSGGALNVTALVCGSYFLIVCIGTWVSKDKKYINWIPFLTALIGGIINVMSPGNFSRHESVVRGGIPS